MTAHELIDQFFSDSPLLNTREFRLFSRLLLHHIAEHTHELCLVDGRRLYGNSDFLLGLRELAEASRIPESLVNSLSNTTIGQGKVNFKMPEQPRWDRTCTKCGHVHEGDGECNVFMGKGGFCDCKAEVVA